MQQNIKAILHHVVENPKETLKKQHRFCPQGKDTWCRFWQDEMQKTHMYSESGRLPSVFMKELQPINADRLSADELLKRCLKGLTQNQNESINSILWSKISKTRFCGKRRVSIAAGETVCTANTGAASKGSILMRLGVKPGRNTLSSLQKEDISRIKSASRKVSQRYRMQRKLRRFQRMKKKTTATSYQSGAFGLSKLPGQIKEKPTLKKKKKVIKRLRKTVNLSALQDECEDDENESSPAITFVNEEDVGKVLTWLNPSTYFHDSAKRKIKSIAIAVNVFNRISNASHMEIHKKLEAGGVAAFQASVMFCKQGPAHYADLSKREKTKNCRDHGSFASVEKCQYNGSTVAVKKLLNPAADGTIFAKEAKILQGIHCQNVLNVHYDGIL
eukprot:gene19662-21609_t